MDTHIILQNSISLESSQFASDPDESESEIISKGVLVMVILSIIGCIFNITITIKTKNHKNPLGMMVIQLCYMDCIWGVVSIFEAFPIASPIICQILSFWEFFGNTGALFCTCCFAHALYVSVRQDSIEIISRYYRLYTLIGLLSGLIGGVVSVATRYYYSPEKCNYCSPSESVFAKVICVVIPSILALLYCFSCYGIVVCKLNEISHRRNYELLCYPLILIVCYFPAVTKIILGISGKDTTVSLGWDLCFNLLYNAQGFLNALAYGMSQNIGSALKATCCKKKESSTQSLTGSFLDRETIVTSYKKEVRLSTAISRE